METVFFIIVIFAAGFFAGLHYGTMKGYDKAMEQLKDATERLEKLYQNKIEALYKLAKDRITKV